MERLPLKIISMPCKYPPRSWKRPVHYCASCASPSSNPFHFSISLTCIRGKRLQIYRYINRKCSWCWSKVKEASPSRTNTHTQTLYLSSVIKSTRRRPPSPPRRIWRPTSTVPTGHWDVVSLGRVSWDYMSFSLGIGLRFRKKKKKGKKEDRKDAARSAVWIFGDVLVLSLSDIGLTDARCVTQLFSPDLLRPLQ